MRIVAIAVLLTALGRADAATRAWRFAPDPGDRSVLVGEGPAMRVSLRPGEVSILPRHGKELSLSFVGARRSASVEGAGRALSFGSTEARCRGLYPGVDLELHDRRGELELTPRFLTAATFDTGRSRVVLFGGLPGEAGAETWEYDADASRLDYLLGPGLGKPNPDRVRVLYDNGTWAGVDFRAYGGAGWGCTVAAGNLDGGFFEEILTGPGPGPTLGPHVRGFSHEGLPLGNASAYAYGTLRYGVNANSRSGASCHARPPRVRLRRREREHAAELRVTLSTGSATAPA